MNSFTVCVESFNSCLWFQFVYTLYTHYMQLLAVFQVYIRDEWFDPCYFFALGRPCTLICNEDTEKAIHIEQDSGNIKNGADIDSVKCNRHHHWLHRKTVADVVEALIGAFIVDSGFTAATAFLRWLGIQVDFKMSDLSQIYAASRNNLSLIDAIDIPALEKMLGYEFLHKGLLLQAFIHPSYNKHSGGCYQVGIFSMVDFSGGCFFWMYTK